jgi:hypothetical protein
MIGIGLIKRFAVRHPPARNNLRVKLAVIVSEPFRFNLNRVPRAVAARCTATD